MQDPTQQAQTTPQEPQGAYPAVPQEEQTIDTLVGTPEVDVLSWVGQQSYDFTCQVRAEEYILEMFTGLPVDEDALVQESIDNGWTSPESGTPPEHSGNLLELHGIPTVSYQNASTYDLANELAQGHKVIVGVDSGELWPAESGGGEGPVSEEDEQVSGSGGEDHAVVVSGIDTTDPNNVQVILSDPGTGEPAAYYPMDQFVAAWQDSSFSVTTTVDPAPASLPEMANFDYETGHIPEVMGMPYEEFATLDPQSEQWNSLVEQVNQTVVDPGMQTPDDATTVEGMEPQTTVPLTETQPGTEDGAQAGDAEVSPDHLLE